MNNESFIISCIRRLREYGHSIVLADQCISSLMTAAKSNVYTIISLSQSSQKDRREVINVLGLDQRQAEATYTLAIGDGIVRLAGRYPYPFLIEIPEIKPQNITDEEIDELNKSIDFVQYFKNRTSSKQSLDSEKGNCTNGPKDTTEDMKRYLMSVYINQYRKTKIEISDFAGFSRGTGSRIANQCQKINLIKIVEVPFGRGKPGYPVLLPDAYGILAVAETKFYGKGAGYEHVLYQHLVAEHLSVYKPKIELNRNGKFLDLAIETNEFILAIEIAVTSSNEMVNIEKDIRQAKADYVVVACLNDKVQEAVQKNIMGLPEDLQNKFECILLSGLLKTPANEFVIKIDDKISSLLNRHE